MNSEIARPIFTIGHSNHAWEVFLDLLRKHGIEMVADVRSSPFSRWAPHFNKARIEESLAASGIAYLFLGDVLGGRPKDGRFYDDEGRVQFARIAETQAFKEGIERLLAERRHRRVAIMCGEGDPKDCHRRVLVAKALREQGAVVIHILTDGTTKTEEELGAEDGEACRNGQLDLLGGEESTGRNARGPVNTGR